jgi:DNA-directed RNA polymerase subunit RPC12/RpoP
MARYKYQCLECKEFTWFSARERTRSSGMRCSCCGSRILEPSKHSYANNNIAAFHDIKRDFDETLDEKRKGLKPE